MTYREYPKNRFVNTRSERLTHTTPRLLLTPAQQTRIRCVTAKDITDVRRILAENVRKQRKQLGMSQFQLAERCGISSSFVGEIETSKKYPSAETLAVLAQALGLAPYQLFLEGSDWEVHDRYDSLRRMYRDMKRKLNETLDESFWDNLQ